MTQPDQPPPDHPGIILERDFMRPRDLSAAQLADQLGDLWSELKIQAIIAGQQGISPKSANDLARFFKTTPDFWTQLQFHYFEWAKKKREKDLGPIKQKKQTKK